MLNSLIPNKRSITVLALAALFSSAASYAQETAAFRSASEGDWYHPIEIEEWVELGGDSDVIEATLQKIANTPGERANSNQPDTLIEFGPGHWTYEWAKNGYIALTKAKEATSNASIKDAALEATTYFYLASSPHTDHPHHRMALRNATEAYLLAGGQIPETVEKVSIAYEGKSFAANLHIPLGNGPFPFVIASQGSDQSKETMFSYFEDFLAPRSIGLLALDLPGMGGSAEYDMTDGRTDKLHLAALEWIKKHPQADARKIFLQGSSFGGNAVARAFLKSNDLDLAGVMYSCGLINEAFVAPPELYAELPTYTTDGVKSRLGLSIGGSFEDFAKRLRPLTLSSTGLMDGQKRKTPLLFISTNKDPVSSLEEINDFLAHAENATRIIIDEEGHCPQSDVEDILMASWIVDQLAAKQK